MPKTEENTVFKEMLAKRCYAANKRKAGDILNKLEPCMRESFKIVRALMRKRKKSYRRKRQKRESSGGKANYYDKSHVVYGLRCNLPCCCDEDTSTVSASRFAHALVDLEDGAQVFGSASDAKNHYKQYHRHEGGEDVEDRIVVTPSLRKSKRRRDARTPEIKNKECVILACALYTHHIHN